MPKVVASLSTLPPRGDHLALTLESLLVQSYKLDAIYVNVPYSARRAQGPIEVPPCLTELSRRAPQIAVLRTEDFGPGTKLLPALQQVRDRDAIVITFDDDMIYDPRVVATLVAASTAHRHWAVGFCGWNVARNGDVERARTSFVDVLQGFAGAAYRRGFFEDDVFRAYQRHPRCFYVDDVWISGYLAEHGHARFLIRPKIAPRHSPNTAVNALRKEPEKVGHNRECALCWRFSPVRGGSPRRGLALPRIRASYALRRSL